jgi:hypothetical protein
MYRTPVEPPLALSSDDMPRRPTKSRIVSVLAVLAALPILAALCWPRRPNAFHLGEDVVVAPPVEKPLLQLADLLKVAPVSPRAVNFAQLATERNAGRDLAFAFDDRVCRAADASPDVQCRALPSDEAGSFVTHTLQSGPPTVRDDLFGWSTRRSHGGAVTLTYRAEFKDRLRLALDAAHELMLAPPRDVMTGPLYYAASLVPGFVMFRGVDHSGEPHLFAQPVSTVDVGPVEDLGRIGPWYAVGTSQQIMSCDGGGALTVAVKSVPNDEGTYRWFVVTHLDGKWTRPALAEEFDNITCRDGESSLTRVTGRAHDVVRQWTCAHGSCVDREAHLPESPERAAVTTDAGVVTVARKDRTLRLRIGAIGALAAAADRLLFDGSDGWLGGFELLPAGSAAALVVSTTRGTFVVRIDGSGVVTPLHARA